MLLTWAGQGLLPQTQTLIAAMTTAPSGARTRLINRTIQQFISSGVWDRCDLIYMLAAHDSQAARLNWKNPGTDTLTVVNSPTFTTDRGYTGDGVSAALTTVYTPVLHTQNDAHASGFGLTQSLNTNGDIGATLPSPTTRTTVRIRNSTGAGGRATGTSTTLCTTTTSVPRHLVANRVNSANQSVYSSGVLDVTAVAASASIATMNEFFILGTPQVGAYADRQIATATIGGGLTDPQIESLYQAQLAYLQNLGAV